MLFKRILGQHPAGVGDQCHRSVGGKGVEQFAGAGTPRQAAVEQLADVVVHPVGELGHAAGVGVQTQIGEHDADHALGRTAHRERPDLGVSTAAVAVVQLVDRDVPQLFGVDEGAVHVPQDRSHAQIVSRRRAANLT